MADLRTLRVQPGFDGLNTYYPPRAIPDNQGAKLENLLPGSKGMVRLRGPIQADAPGTIANPLSPQDSSFTHGGKVLIARTTNSNTDVSFGVPGASPFSTATATRAMKPRGRCAELDDNSGVHYSYIANYDPGAVGAVALGTNRVLLWDGGTAPTVLTNGPLLNLPGASVCTHLGRIFASNGNYLFWTDAGGSPSNLATEWQDDVTGLTNKIVVGDGTSDQILGLVKIGRNLGIICQNSIYLLTGDTTSTFAVRHITSGIGMLEYSDLCPWDEGAYFFSDGGVYFFDGVSTTCVSMDVGAELTEAIAAATTLSFARLSSDHLLVSVYSTTAPFFGMFHVPTQSWSTVSLPATLFPATTPRRIGTSSGYAWMFDGTTIWPLRISPPEIGTRTSINAPDTWTATSRGFDSSLSGAVSKAIPAKWWSKVYDLTAPTLKTKLHRIMVEYDFRTGAAVPAGQGLYVSVYDSLGTQLLAPTELEEGTTRQRKQIDCFAETSDVQVRIEYANTTATNVTKLELHDCFVEHQATSQR